MNLFRSAPQFRHGQLLSIADNSVRLRVDGRARRVSIRIDEGAGVAVLTAPSERRLDEAVGFARARAAWIAERLARLPGRLALSPGLELSLFGEPCRLEAGAGRAQLIAAGDGQPLRLSAPPGDRYAAAILRLIKGEARRVLAERTAVHAAALGEACPTVSLGDPKSRWGSCTPARRTGFGGRARVGSIRYSWRLALAPFEVADYVVAHECCHLIEANHGPAFWALVEGLVPDWKLRRKWLRASGAGLHAIGQ